MHRTNLELTSRSPEETQRLGQALGALAEAGDKLPLDEKARVTAALDELKSAVKSGDADHINAAMDNLTKASHAMAQEMYSHTQKPGDQGNGSYAYSSPGGGTSSQSSGPGPHAEEPKKGSGTVDADFEVVN